MDWLKRLEDVLGADRERSVRSACSCRRRPWLSGPPPRRQVEDLQAICAQLQSLEPTLPGGHFPAPCFLPDDEWRLSFHQANLESRRRIAQVRIHKCKSGFGSIARGYEMVRTSRAPAVRFSMATTN